MANKIKQFTLGLVESATEYSIKKFIQETGITPVDYMFSNNKIGQVYQQEQQSVPYFYTDFFYLKRLY